MYSILFNESKESLASTSKTASQSTLINNSHTEPPLLPSGQFKTEIMVIYCLGPNPTSNFGTLIGLTPSFLSKAIKQHSTKGERLSCGTREVQIHLVNNAIATHSHLRPSGKLYRDVCSS